MGIRDVINRKPAVTSGIGAILLLLSLTFIIVQLRSRHQPSADTRPAAFYSDDDGKTWFVADADRATPFDHDGKNAYRAMVFRCRDGSAFVAYLQRDSQGAATSTPSPSGVVPARFSGLSMQARRPGATAWLSSAGSTADAYRSLMTPACPDGSSGVTLVRPTDANDGAKAR